jgi:hypothetical protein
MAGNSISDRAADWVTKVTPPESVKCDIAWFSTNRKLLRGEANSSCDSGDPTPEEHPVYSQEMSVIEMVPEEPPEIVRALQTIFLIHLTFIKLTI